MYVLIQLFILALIFVSALPAQDLTGIWQGTLQAPNRQLRTVIRISGDAGALKAVLFSIDQPGAGVNATSVTLQGSAVKVAIPGLAGAYSGTLSPDGNSIAGAWTEGASSMILNLHRVSDEAAWPIPAAPRRLKPMSADADPAFEVASIKLSQPDAPGKIIHVEGNRLSTVNYSVSDLVTWAYGVHQRQIAGGPAWFATDRFDIVGESDGESQPNERQWRSMMQKLLAERFGLTFHHDSRELPVYAITVLSSGARSGTKLLPVTADPDALPGFGDNAPGSLLARNVNMGEFARHIQRIFLDRPVVDRTGLTAKYDFTLEWRPDEFQFANYGVKMSPLAGNSDSRPDLFTAFQQQLGLKLESTKAVVDVLVIDRVEHPSDN